MSSEERESIFQEYITGSNLAEREKIKFSLPKNKSSDIDIV